MGLNQAIYVACAAAFVGLIGLILLRGRPSRVGLAVVGACALSAAWSAVIAVPGMLPAGGGAVFDSVRLAAWLMLLVLLVNPAGGSAGGSRAPIVLSLSFCGTIVGCDLLMLAGGGAVADALGPAHDIMRVTLAVGGLLAAENLLRNSGETHGRHLRPLCLALGTIFAFELFIYAERLMLPAASASSVLDSGAGLVSLLAVPLLALGLARYREWQVDIHVSHTVVLHTAALVASGVFFLALAAVGIVVREFGGVWGPSLQVLALIGSAVVLIVVMGSREVRLLLKRSVAKHFFSHRYDYRAEWLRFADTVSRADAGNEGLAARVVRALAQIVDSPAGALWSLQGSGYVFTAALNLRFDGARQIPSDDTFIAGFRTGLWVQERSPRGGADWPVGAPRAWLAIPLAHQNSLVGFVILASPWQPRQLDTESFDLLRAAGRQAASYLAEEQSTRELIDAQLLNDFSKRFAFVVHDIKNLAAQLGLVVSNARRHIENPEFRADMLLTVESAVGNLNRLIARLHATGEITATPVEPDALIADVVRELSSEVAPIETRLGAGESVVAIDPNQLRSALTHLINNAREAGGGLAKVVVETRRIREKIAIDVVDNGPGMDDAFVRNDLFRPFRSTKPGGLGIGIYQVRELLRAVGGDLEVLSNCGTGTIMRMSVPVHRRGDMAAAE
jgi:putative PEP-CTERM system histidine kinase